MASPSNFQEAGRANPDVEAALKKAAFGGPSEASSEISQASQARPAAADQPAAMAAAPKDSPLAGDLNKFSQVGFLAPLGMAAVSAAGAGANAGVHVTGSVVGATGRLASKLGLEDAGERMQATGKGLAESDAANGLRVTMQGPGNLMKREIRDIPGLAQLRAAASNANEFLGGVPGRISGAVMDRLQPGVATHLKSAEPIFAAAGSHFAALHEPETLLAPVAEMRSELARLGGQHAADAASRLSALQEAAANGPAALQAGMTEHLPAIDRSLTELGKNKALKAEVKSLQKGVGTLKGNAGLLSIASLKGTPLEAHVADLESHFTALKEAAAASPETWHEGLNAHFTGIRQSLGEIEKTTAGRAAIKPLKANLTKLEHTFGSALDRQGVGHMQLGTGMMNAGLLACSAASFANDAHGAAKAVKSLRELCGEMEGAGKLPSKWHVLTSHDVPDAVKHARAAMIKQFGPLGLLDTGVGAVNLRMMGRGTGGKAMMMMGFVQMAADMFGRGMLPKDQMLPAYAMLNNAQKSGQHLSAAHYAELLGVAAPHLAASPDILGMLTPLMEASQTTPAMAIRAVEPARLKQFVTQTVEKEYAATGHVPEGHYAALMALSSKHIEGVGTSNGLVAALARECVAAQTPPAALIEQIRSGAFDRHATEVEAKLVAEGRQPGTPIAPPAVNPAPAVAAAPAPVDAPAGPAPAQGIASARMAPEETVASALPAPANDIPTKVIASVTRQGNLVAANNNFRSGIAL